MNDARVRGRVLNPRVASDGDNATEGEFVTEADWVPAFWNFLAGLDCDDLVAELVQNDLDQDATRTVISFEHGRLVCEGNGKPVDAEGWQRLRKIQGAGHIVPAKRGKIGVKNHGLKTAFTIGDEIQVLSAGQAITQTLYRNGRSEPPFPGASPAPKPHPAAPLSGCRIIVNYRSINIEPQEGEALVLRAIGEKEIASLFHSACTNTPEQFAGIVSPEVAPRYEIIVRHWSLGEARFLFSCTRPRKIAKGIELFRRRCNVEVKGSAPAAPLVHEQAARRPLPLRGRLKERLPGFFRRGNRFLVEVSWRVDRRGKPLTGMGRFRYPIGYPVGSQEARTGHGLFYNAPIVSDTERHGPARNDATNDDLYQACNQLAVDVIARDVVPRWGPDGLAPLVPLPGHEGANDKVRPLLAGLAKLDAIPAIRWGEAVQLLVKANKRYSLRAPRRLHQRKETASRKYRFAIPVPLWTENEIYAPLAVLCPPHQKQLDPRVHEDIIRLLADRGTDGFYGLFITFDETDAFNRITGEHSEFFDDWADRERDLAHLMVAQSCLDLINQAIDHENCDAQTQAALQGRLLLPTQNSLAAPFNSLNVSAPLPSDIPGLNVPPILHKDIASHPLLRRENWRRPTYTMSRFLESDALRSADGQTRALFWEWLSGNERHFALRDRATLASLAIWPDTSGHLCALTELCEPKSRRVAAILIDSIRRPHEKVLESNLARTRGGRGTRLRSVPSHAEISAWLNRRMATFVPGTTSEQDTTAAVRRFETEVAELLRHSPIASVLRGVSVELPALAQDGLLARRSDLVISSRHTDRLSVPKRFLLASGAPAALDSLSAPLTDPTLPMLVAAFKEDGGNFAALQGRLGAFLSLSTPGDSYRGELANLPILPVHGVAKAPSDLAFTGPRGDYWGTWKSRISARGLSQDEQARYLNAGVTSAIPAPDTSRTFMTWLAKQNTSVIEQHTSCVLRHILHPGGPSAWANAFTDVPFIPVRGSDGVRLISLQTARSRPVYLPDVRDVAEAIAEGDSGIFLVIDRVREVPDPISEQLRELGVRSLREAIGEPEHVIGSGTITEAPAAVRERFEALRSFGFRRTILKRLDDLGVSVELIRRDWHDRLSQIESFRCADAVTARYRLHGKTYALRVKAGFDLRSATFWIEGQGLGVSNVYEAIAEQLVFKAAARPVHFLALERALLLEIRDPSFAKPGVEASAALSGNFLEGDAEQAESRQLTEDDAEPGQAIFGHSPFQPDPTRNIPKARPIPQGLPPVPSRPQGRARRNDTNTGVRESMPTPELEREHVEALKKDQYASHCQMCLCKRSPQELAPTGCYVEWEEVRRRVVEAHHLDVKSGGGARHAGNLVLLCKLHHDNFGRRLTRAAITRALGSEATQCTIRFGDRDDDRSQLQGVKIDIEIADTGECVSLFFTDQHAAYWLSQV